MISRAVVCSPDKEQRFWAPCVGSSGSERLPQGRALQAVPLVKMCWSVVGAFALYRAKPQLTCAVRGSHFSRFSVKSGIWTGKKSTHWLWLLVYCLLQEGASHCLTPCELSAQESQSWEEKLSDLVVHHVAASPPEEICNSLIHSSRNDQSTSSPKALVYLLWRLESWKLCISLSTMSRIATSATLPILVGVWDVWDSLSSWLKNITHWTCTGLCRYA